MKNFVNLLLLSFVCFSCNNKIVKNTSYKPALVSYTDYEKLVEEVREVRAKNLISFDELLKYQKEENAVILDTRSKDKYDRKHIKGAINLPFTEFTQINLRQIVPDTNTRIILYCNNNFEGDQISFASKVFVPETAGNSSLLPDDSSIMMALNIPTYINLYGYGYRNIMELDELVNINDPRLKLEGNSIFGGLTQIVR